MVNAGRVGQVIHQPCQLLDLILDHSGRPLEIGTRRSLRRKTGRRCGRGERVALVPEQWQELILVAGGFLGSGPARHSRNHGRPATGLRQTQVRQGVAL